MLDDQGVSPAHAEIVFKDGHVGVRDSRQQERDVVRWAPGAADRLAARQDLPDRPHHVRARRRSPRRGRRGADPHRRRGRDPRGGGEDAGEDAREDAPEEGVFSARGGFAGPAAVVPATARGAATKVLPAIARPVERPVERAARAHRRGAAADRRARAGAHRRRRAGATRVAECDARGAAVLGGDARARSDHAARESAPCSGDRRRCSGRHDACSVRRGSAAAVVARSSARDRGRRHDARARGHLLPHPRRHRRGGRAARRRQRGDDSRGRRARARDRYVGVLEQARVRHVRIRRWSHRRCGDKPSDRGRHRAARARVALGLRLLRCELGDRMAILRGRRERIPGDRRYRRLRRTDGSCGARHERRQRRSLRARASTTRTATAPKHSLAVPALGRGGEVHAVLVAIRERTQGLVRSARLRRARAPRRGARPGPASRRGRQRGARASAQRRSTGSRASLPPGSTRGASRASRHGRRDPRLAGVDPGDVRDARRDARHRRRRGRDR